MFFGLHNKSFFKITRKNKEDIKPSDYREWTKAEKEKYYQNFDKKNNWSDYYMNCVKYLYEKYGIIYTEELQKNNNSIKDKDKNEKILNILRENFNKNESYVKACDLFYSYIEKSSLL